VSHLKKRILTPGEMETAVIKAETFAKYPNCQEITVKVEA
jgi:sarcosine oxidase subunit alpha